MRIYVLIRKGYNALYQTHNTQSLTGYTLEYINSLGSDKIHGLISSEDQLLLENHMY